MKKIEFKAGYYEWNLFIDDEFIYCFGDSDNENFDNMDELETYVDMCIDAMDMDAKDTRYGESNCYGFVGEHQKENAETWLSLTKEEKEQVKKEIIKGWSRYVDVNLKARSFYYKGYWFKPKGNLKGNFAQKSKYGNFKDVLDIKDYNYNDFYKVAKEHHASCDVFEVCGTLYIPATYVIASIVNNPQIKPLDSYSRWYH